MRSSTRMKSNDTAKKSAMAELVAAQARRKKSQGSKSRYVLPPDGYYGPHTLCAVS